MGEGAEGGTGPVPAGTVRPAGDRPRLTLHPSNLPSAAVPVAPTRDWPRRPADRQAVVRGRPRSRSCDAARHVDPVVEKRRRIARWVDLGQKVGYGLFGLAVVAFVVGFVVGLQQWVVTLIVVSLVVGSLVLAPAIVFGYAVRAADRADREDSW